MDNSPDRRKLRMWFAFGLRLLGFWEILTAAGYFITGLNISMGFTKSVTGSTTFGSFMTQTFGHLILALWLVNGAPSIARFIYPERPTDENDSTGKPSDSDTPTI
jgi:hypothetical protein